jgi:hypothetical protein
MLDEEFDMLGEEDLALLSRQFERMYKNRKDAQRSSGMCYRCEKHGHFLSECPEAMEVKPEHKHHPRMDHKHRSRDDYKGKNKSELRPRKNDDEDTTNTFTPAAPSPTPAPAAPSSAPPSGRITRARAREFNFVMMLKNEGPKD